MSEYCANCKSELDDDGACPNRCPNPACPVTCKQLEEAVKGVAQRLRVERRQTIKALDERIGAAVTREELGELETEVKRLADAVLELATGLKTEMRLRQATDRRLGRLRDMLLAEAENAREAGTVPTLASNDAIIYANFAAALEEGDPEQSRGAALAEDEERMEQPSDYGVVACDRPRVAKPEEAGGEALWQGEVEVQAEEVNTPFVSLPAVPFANLLDQTVHVLITRRPGGQARKEGAPDG